MSIILAGDRSGTGKTTLTLALLAALKQQGHCVQSFKVGPDYIDPMFHSAVTERFCYSLDPVLTSEAYVQRSFQAHCIGAQQAVVEGVMGLFDGATGVDDTASTAHIARLLGLPVVLAVDCGRMARSVAALVKGYRDFDRRVRIAGVVLNRVGSDRHLQLLENAIASINLPILGVFRREKDIQLPSRHLGLVPTGEVGEFGEIAGRLAALGQWCFDWERLGPLLRVEKEEKMAGDIGGVEGGMPFQHRDIDGSRGVRIAIARDAAFNFYYPDNFETLEAQGATLIYWSPLTDSELPKADGLYFGGGFPEVFAKQLAENVAIRRALKQVIEQGIPTYAECGGLMYLSQSLVDFDAEAWPMVGVIAQTVKMGGGLALGYRKGCAIADTPLLTKGQTIVGHEFHKSTVVEPLSAPVYKSQRYWGGSSEPQVEGYRRKNLHASYVHLCWGDRSEIPKRFIAHCRAYAKDRQSG